MKSSRKCLFVDNFDSFTYNLVDDFCKRDCEAQVYRADTTLEQLKEIAREFDPDLLLISPGPGTPQSAGVSLAAVDYFKDKLPIFGVCLGHQTIVQYFGGEIGHAPQPMHGKLSHIKHDGKDVFEGVESPMEAGRYHSLIATSLPESGVLKETAWFVETFKGVDHRIVMGVKHEDLPIFGVQFHPESILTPTGGKIIENVLSIAAASGARA